MRQLSDESLEWCRRIARQIKRGYYRYLGARQRVNGSKSVIVATNSPPPVKNRIDDAYVTIFTWDELLEDLTEEERELLEELTEGPRVGSYFTRKEKDWLRSLFRKGREKGVW